MVKPSPGSGYILLEKGMDATFLDSINIYIPSDISIHSDKNIYIKHLTQFYSLFLF